jgi:hypothetical protein
VVGLITLSGEALRVADVSGNGAITAYDSALILQFSVGLIDKFPADKPQGISAYRAVTRQLDLTLQDEKARQFFIPVQIDEANGVLAYDFLLSYNPSILEIQEVRKIHPDDFLEYQADAGELKITLARTEPLQGQNTEMIIVGTLRSRSRQPISSETRFLRENGFLDLVSVYTSFSLSSVWIAKSRPTVGFDNPTGALQEWVTPDFPS